MLLLLAFMFAQRIYIALRSIESGLFNAFFLPSFSFSFSFSSFIMLIACPPLVMTQVTSLAVRDSICRAPGGEASLQAFQLLVGLYRFTDAAWGGQGFPGNCNWPVALAVVDQLGLLPASRPQVSAAVRQTQILVSGGGGGGASSLSSSSSSVGSREPALRPEHLRHVLLGTMRCLHFKQQALREGASAPPSGGGGGAARGLPPDAGSLAENTEHAKALMEFASQGQFEHHSSDTMVEMSQMMSGIAY